MDEKMKTIIKWLENEVNGKNWDEYLKSYGYKKIAIYGAGDLGKYLIWALNRSNLEISCVIDRRASEIEVFEHHEVYTLESFLEKNIETDAIVVTAINAYEEVLEHVARIRPELPVLFLRDMVYEF